MIDYDFYKDHISCYKSPSFIEKEVNGRLLERLEFINISPNSILELGSGHGYGVKLLQERFPSASLYAQDFNKEALNYMLENKILGARETHRLVINTHQELAPMGKPKLIL